MLKTLLSKIGISAFTAENGRVALDMVLPDKDLFDIVFMDNQMPVMVATNSKHIEFSLLLPFFHSTCTIIRMV